MKVTNNLVEKTETKKTTLSAYLNSDKINASISGAIQNEKERVKFIASLVSAYSTNPALQSCTYPSIVSAALTAHSLNLSLAPQLGFCYAIPFKVKEKVMPNGKVVPEHYDAQFQMGYRGYIQLAIRSGYYEDIDVLEVREGEYLGRDGVSGKHRFAFISDDDVRENKPIVGYLAYFVQLNGFKKQIYWSKDKMLKHADRYSQAFSLNGTDKKVSYADFVAGKYPKSDAWKYSSFWYTSFDDMAFKTMLKQLISKWGIMSLDMQKAFNDDGDSESPNDTAFNGFVNDDGEIIAPIPAEEEQPEKEEKPPKSHKNDDFGGEGQTEISDIFFGN